MKLLKSAVVALSLAFSLGAVSTSAVACEGGRVCVSPSEGIAMTLEHINAGLATDNTDEIYEHAKAAKDTSKEINANDKVDRARIRANGHLSKAKTAAKKGKADEAKQHLEAAKKGFESLKGLL
jgi:hypothetical protein